jgi:hypothetical protein
MMTSVLKNLLMAQSISNKRFIDIAQTLYIQGFLTAEGLGNVTEAERRESFKKLATICLEAADEFSAVFGGIEDF